MASVAVLSMHTSPLVQPGAGDSGGMNVYVRELVSAVAQTGVDCTVYTRRWRADLADEVAVEPGFVVRHIDAGPPGMTKEALPDVVDQFTAGVRAELATRPVDLLHANYWLSGLVGHQLKHELDVPLVCTFHTLARVKATSGDPEPARRERAEADIIGCCDAICVSCTEEHQQVSHLYGDPPGRLEIVEPGVEHAFFSPGDRGGARRALGIALDRPVVLFVGRIQPLKGLDVAVRAVAHLRDRNPQLLVVGGASGAAGEAEVARIHALVAELDLACHVRFVDPQPHHLLSSYYRASDVCLVPSRSESFGLVALEAGACGTPVVAAAVGGLRTLVDHGRSGFLVEGREPAAFAAYVMELLDNPALAATMGTRAANRARRYTWSTAAARLRRLYADLTVGALVEC